MATPISKFHWRLMR